MSCVLLCTLGVGPWSIGTALVTTLLAMISRTLCRGEAIAAVHTSASGAADRGSSFTY